jgi:hypothetical protein
MTAMSVSELSIVEEERRPGVTTSIKDGWQGVRGGEE